MLLQVEIQSPQLSFTLNFLPAISIIYKGDWPLELDIYLGK